ncbi:SH3 domain-containing kinase-binding protein 1 [Clinocottus analis]|uniref:SH3 domain-containing kinase-binding protein 1 n=1 Tax=Clinocottus analis TaxID=304258 RepID=UPI0035BF332A
MMEEERKETRSEEPDSVTPQENAQETRQNESTPSASVKEKAAAPKTFPVQSFSSLLPKALSAALHLPAPPGLSSDPQPSRNTPNLQQLQTDLKDLRDQFELMKSQHNKEIHLLMNELDEEKRIRLTLQMEIQRMKKHMSK